MTIKVAYPESVPRKAKELYDECSRNMMEVSPHLSFDQLLEVAKYGAMMEIAAQLAALNEKLDSMSFNETQQARQYPKTDINVHSIGD